METGRVRRTIARWHDVPPLVKAATVAFAGLCISMMFLYPANYGFDEPQHFDMAYSYSQGHGVLAPGNRNLSLGVLNESHHYARGFPPSHLVDRPIAGRGHRLTINELGGDAPSPGVYDQMTQHPPLYYLMGGAILAVPGVSHLPYDYQFTLLRILSLLLMLPVPWLCYASARRLGAATLAPSAALFPLLLPAMGRTGGSVTNDSLLVLTATAATYLIIRVLTGDSSMRTATWLAVWIALAVLTKVFALPLPIIAVLAYVVLWLREHASVIKPLLVVCAGSAIGGIWWLHNVIAYGTLSPDGTPPGYGDAHYAKIAQGTGGTLGPFIGHVLHLYTSRFWGSIGLIEAPDYSWTFALTGTIVVLGLLAVAMVLGIGGRWGRVAVVVPLLYIPLLMASSLSSPYHVWQKYKLLPALQGRYLYAAIGIIAGFTFWAMARLLPQRFHRYVAPAVVLCAAFAQAFTLHAVVVSWWLTAHPSGTVTNWKNALHTILDWAPWPEGVSIVLGLGIVAAGVWVTVEAVRRPTADTTT